MKNIQRQCRGCKKLKNREDMIKITLSNGELVINPDSKTFGRSVYVCKDSSCINLFIKSKGIKKGLKFNDDAKIKAAEKALTLLN